MDISQKNIEVSQRLDPVKEFYKFAEKIHMKKFI